MAKIKFGMMMTDARGKLGGQVFSKNRSGAYVRTKVTPSNPQTVYQQANRSRLGFVSSAWSSLTDGQRTAWNNAVENWQKTNVFGDSVKPSGKNLFSSLNKNIQDLFTGSDLLLLPPTKTEFLGFTVSSAVLTASTGAFAVTLAGAGANGSNFKVRATPPLTEGTSYVKNMLRGLGNAFVSNETGVLAIGTEYADRFGTVVPGANVFIEVTACSENGQLGVPVIFKASVV